MSIRLRELIRAVRACKTAAEERAVISKECAMIRTAIKEEHESFRERNVAKLMYIHMLGYPTHFGQMECLKLISAQGFSEKRIGYLALTLLLTEATEVLTLVTNSLKVDLTSPNQFIQALSLIAIGNLATQDMARDLISDVEKLLQSNNAYLRKKAALATIRLLKKEPDLIEGLEGRIVSLLKDRSHGVLLTGMQLIIEVVQQIPETTAEYAKLVPALVRLLRNFLSSGYSAEYDVSGITDPFMQVKILRLLRLLGRNNEEASEQMNDVLAQVATNTDTSKNTGNAILYECVQTIMEVESDASARVLAVNILGRFLLNRDNNIRYVALNSLSRVVADDIGAVQRHRNTIVDCLKDPDVSIRARALELIYQLVNDQNVVQLTSEMLNYLVVAPVEHRSNLASKIVSIVERYSTNKKWRVDTVITMLSVAGSITDESVARNCILFISQSDGLQGYATHRLYRAFLEDPTQMGLLQVAVWCIGEYGFMLLKDCPAMESSGMEGLIGNTGAQNGVYSALTEVDILAALSKVLKSHTVDIQTKALLINALAKLSVRFGPQFKNQISELMEPFRHSMTLELQQRSTEYSVLLGAHWDSLRSKVLDTMPILTPVTVKTPEPAAGGSAFAAPDLLMPSATKPSSGGDLLDLDDIFGGGGSSTTPSVAATPIVTPSASSGMDLLADIFSAPAVSVTPTPVMPTHPANDLLSLSSMGAALPPAQPYATQPVMATLQPIAMTPSMPSAQSFVAYESGALSVLMEYSKPTADASITKIRCLFSNRNGSPLESFVFQAAVPKYLRLDMFSASSNVIPPHSTNAVSQEIQVVNSQQGQKNIMLKLKISYKLNGAPVEEMAQVSAFPPLY